MKRIQIDETYLKNNKNDSNDNDKKGGGHNNKLILPLWRSKKKVMI